jgi:hypothetical protein
MALGEAVTADPEFIISHTTLAACALQARKGDYAGTLVLPSPIYKRLAPIGGSNAQRDLLVRTLGIVAYKTGHLGLVREIATVLFETDFPHPKYLSW